jgi:high-affinity iron transporter
LLGLALLLSFGPRLAIAASDEEIVARLRQMIAILDRAEAAVRVNDVPAAQAAFQEYARSWAAIEDDIRPRARQMYLTLEENERALQAALWAQPFDSDRAMDAIDALRNVTRDLSVLFPSTRAEATASDLQSSARALLNELEQAQTALAARDYTAAAAAVGRAQQRWPDIEGAIKIKSPATYAAVEDNLARAQAALASRPPDVTAAQQAIDSLKTDLLPYTQSSVTYSAVDAGITLLREGLEALLVVTALLAFLERMGNRDKQVWIWAGAAAGVLLSVLVAILLQAILSRLVTGSGGELLEGLTGVIAAALLIGVSYWFHSKASLQAWQRYIHTQGMRALAKGSLFSLALLSFLAVFREGGETALFLIGMATAISLSDLLLGLAGGALLLAVIGVLLLRFGVRLPIRPFFLVTSALIFYLAFKFIGTGIHALQVAGVVRLDPIPLPSVDWLGFFPTWETALPQALLLLAAGGVLVWGWWQRRQGVQMPSHA